MEITFKPKGVCSRLIEVKTDENGIVKAVHFEGGCNGNAQGVSALSIGQPIDELISKLKGIKCGFKQTSCPDQLACALEEMKKTSH